MFMSLLCGCAVYLLQRWDSTVDLSRNQAEPQTLSVPASLAAPPFLFLCAAEREAASRSGNIAATPV